MSFESPASDDSRQSKTQRKQQMHALQALGEKIIALDDTQRARLPLSDEMLAAVEETARIRSHEGRRRHMQYVGKVMRGEDLAAIQAAFEAIEQKKLQRDHGLQRLEKWRERLIDSGNEALEAFISEYPDVDRQALRQLIRNAQRERSHDKPPASARKLFRLIRDTAGL